MTAPSAVVDVAIDLCSCCDTFAETAGGDDRCIECVNAACSPERACGHRASSRDVIA